MTRYYRVIKDTPLWEVGAILGNIDDRVQYVAIEDVWNKIEKCENFYEHSNIIEHSPEFFERVYKDQLDKAIFYTKDQMKKVYEKFKK